MSDHNNDQITQKDLLKLLFDQAQHNATREEVEALRLELKGDIEKSHSSLEAKIDSVSKELDSKIDSVSKELDSKIDSVSKKLDARLDKQDAQISKLDNRLWWIAGLIVALAFKTEILAYFQG